MGATIYGRRLALLPDNYPRTLSIVEGMRMRNLNIKKTAPTLMAGLKQEIQCTGVVDEQTAHS